MTLGSMQESERQKIIIRKKQMATAHSMPRFSAVRRFAINSSLFNNKDSISDVRVAPSVRYGVVCCDLGAMYIV